MTASQNTTPITRSHRQARHGTLPGDMSSPAPQLPGKRLRVTKWIHGRVCVVRVEVDAVVPDADPSEPCLEPATLRWLDELQKLADAGDVEALADVGEVFVRRTA
jgi:hypothetical protein